MRGSHPATLRSHSLLSLVLLVANVGAPFRTCDLGRAFLAQASQTAAHVAPIVRVRAVSAAGVTHGFRAVVGLTKGGPDGAVPGARLHPCALRPSADRLATRHLGLPVFRPNPPLRC
jgi:hypothetical protein